MKQSVPIIKYPLDLSGTNPNNLVIQEFHDIGPDTGRALAPDHGPFYVASLKVTERITGRLLEPHIDYMVLQPYQKATARTGKEVSAVIYVHNKSVADEITIEYQVVGGEFSWSIFAIKQLIEDLNLDNRPVHWGDIIGRPLYFPPAPHLHPLSDTFGWEFIGYQLEEIARAVLNGDVGAHEELIRIITLETDYVKSLIADLKEYAEDHVADVDNPHQTTKAQVGLGSVQNYPVATQPEAEAGTATNRYMTPLRTGQAIEVLAGNLLRTHTSNWENPHQTTKAQVGLGLVENFPLATQAEAVAATVDNRYMTPLRTGQAIEVLALALLRPHLENANNPHGVTKAQVGLGSVQNYPVATQPEAEAGTATNRYMTPQRTAQAINILAGNLLRIHLEDTNNPHQTTKAQVGLGSVQNYPVATQPEAEAGTATNRYMTPQRTAQAINILAGNLLRIHLEDKGNPHAVTKAQVGLGLLTNYANLTAAQATVLGTLPTNGNYTQGYVRSSDFIDATREFNRLSVAPHIANKSNPHAVTKAQVGLSEIPNAISAARNLNSNTSLATSKALFDHVASGDHDARYVRIGATANTSLKWENNCLYAYGGGAWRQIFPAQWS